MGRNLLFFIISSFFISGCGPSTTARDVEKQQESLILQKQIGEMAPIEGKWMGRLIPFGRNITEQEAFAVLAGKDPAKEAAKDPAPNLNIIKGGNHPPPANPNPNPAPPTPPPPKNPVPPPGLGVNLQVLVVSLLQPVPGRNENVEVPTFMGVWKGETADENQVVFTNGLYNPANGHVQLMSATVPSPSSPVISPTILQLTLVDPDTMKGRLIAPQLIGDVVLKRIK